MGLAVTGIVAIKDVQKSFEQTAYGNKTVFMGTLLTKEEFGTNNMEIPFKLSASEKQAKFYEQYFMKPGQSGFAKGHLLMTQGGLAIELEKMEFGALKTDFSAQKQQPATNYTAANPQAAFQQPVTPAPVADNMGAFNNMFNNNQPEEQPAGVEVPAAGNTSAFWKNMGK